MISKQSIKAKLSILRGVSLRLINLFNLIALLLVCAVISLTYPYNRAERVFDVQPGDSINRVARNLAEQGIIINSTLMKMAARISPETTFKAGEYVIPANASIMYIIEQMSQGRVRLHFIKIDEGEYSAVIVNQLLEDNRLSGEMKTIPPEGSMLADTYAFYSLSSREELLATMRSNLLGYLDHAWPNRDPSIPLKTKEEAVILASIVEKESTAYQEQPVIAGVFYNRLAKKMRLQSDPTVIYAITGGKKPLERLLTRDDLKFVSSYNTYLNSGLPPTPIGNVSKRAIDAVLHPIKTNYLYFVSNGFTEHHFAENYKQHLQNVRRYKRVIKINAANYLKKAK